MIIWFSFLGTIPTLNWNPTGITVAGTGVPGTAANQLNGSFSLALYSSNTLYISDQNNSRVQKWDLNAWVGITVAGQASGTPGSGAAFLYKAGGVAVDSAGSVYVVDMYNCTVQYWPVGSVTGTPVAGIGRKYEPFRVLRSNSFSDNNIKCAREKQALLELFQLITTDEARFLPLNSQQNSIFHYVRMILLDFYFIVDTTICECEGDDEGVRM
jgi:hypothetical protein